MLQQAFLDQLFLWFTDPPNCIFVSSSCFSNVHSGWPLGASRRHEARTSTIMSPDTVRVRWGIRIDFMFPRILIKAHTNCTAGVGLSIPPFSPWVMHSLLQSRGVFRSCFYFEIGACSVSLFLWCFNVNSLPPQDTHTYTQDTHIAYAGYTQATCRGAELFIFFSFTLADKMPLVPSSLSLCAAAPASQICSHLGCK